VFAYHKHPKTLRRALAKYLGPLLDFAKTILKEKEDQWHTYPIFLKATGGMRTVPKEERVRLMEVIRDLFLDETFNPFAFKIEQARVISGEEEAIYGWVGVNFAVAKDTLIHGSKGSGEARDPRLTYGMLEMGGTYCRRNFNDSGVLLIFHLVLFVSLIGASTQIAFFENNGDVMVSH
jgi:Golgi nucleoside diphosphatase